MVHFKQGRLNFIITCSTNSDNINDFISTIDKYKITNIVRACDLLYDDSKIKSLCNVHEYIFEDGKFPSDELVHKWINLLYYSYYYDENKNSLTDPKADTPILIHCQAGLGRAPLLACIALIICENMDPVAAISLVRKHVKGSLNTVQLRYITNTK